MFTSETHRMNAPSIATWYHQQQNKWYPKGFYLLISIHTILAVANLLAHNNITISYYVQVNSLG